MAKAIRSCWRAVPYTKAEPARRDSTRSPHPTCASLTYSASSFYPTADIPGCLTPLDSTRGTSQLAHSLSCQRRAKVGEVKAQRSCIADGVATKARFKDEASSFAFALRESDTKRELRAEIFSRLELFS